MQRLIQFNFADADNLERAFDTFIVFGKFEAFFERKSLGVVAKFLSSPPVQLHFFGDFPLNVVGSGVFFDQHATVDGVAGLYKESQALW